MKSDYYPYKDSDIPTHSPYCYLKNQNNRFYIYNINSGETININETMALIWQLCNDAKSAENIIDIIAEIFAEKPDNIKPDILNALNQLNCIGLIIFYKKNDAKIKKKRKNQNFYEKNFPDIRQTQITELKQTHAVLLRMLKIFDYLAKKYKFNYWLTFGTLLGAVRHKGFIPWDIDVDIAMTGKNYNKFLKKGAPNLPEDIFFKHLQQILFITTQLQKQN